MLTWYCEDPTFQHWEGWADDENGKEVLYFRVEPDEEGTYQWVDVSEEWGIYQYDTPYEAMTAVENQYKKFTKSRSRDL